MTFGGEFLSVPDLFPARRSGERWGDQELCLEFAGGPYLFRGLSKKQAELLGHHYEEILGAFVPGRDHVEVRVFRVAESEFRELEPILYRPMSMDLDYQQDLVRVAAQKFMGSLSFSPIRAALWTAVEEPLDMLVGVFANLFRLVVAYRMGEIGGALLHSAGVVRDSRAYLFLGKSGAGKSTISRINQEAGLDILSDDLNALLPERSRVVVEKVPFAGELGQTGSRGERAPLAGLFRLEQAETHALTPLPEPQAMALLLSCSPYLNGDPHRTDRLMENLSSLIRGCVFARLAFRRDAEFWKLIDEAL